MATKDLTAHNREALALAMVRLKEATERKADGQCHGRIAMELFLVAGRITGHELHERTTEKHV